MKKRQIKSLLPIAIIAAAVLLAVLMVAARPEPQQSNGSQPLPMVKVIAVHKGDVPVTVVAHGNVSAWRKLDLTSEVTGRVVWVSPDFEPGRRVSADSPLLRIESTSYQLALAEAKAALASAELAQADAKVQRGSAAIAEAKANVAAAQLRITKAEKELANTEIRAPYNAVLDAQLVELGQYITVGQQVGRILGSDKAEIRLPVIAADIGFLSEQAEETVSVFAQIGQYEQQWQARLSTIEARVDEQTRVFPVMLEVVAPSDVTRHATVLPFGLFVRAEIPGKPVTDAVLVPALALHEDNTVFIFADGGLQKRQVTVVRSSSRGVIITDGLDEGDVVVISRLELMFDGMPVALGQGQVKQVQSEQPSYE